MNNKDSSNSIYITSLSTPTGRRFDTNTSKLLITTFQHSILIICLLAASRAAVGASFFGLGSLPGTNKIDSAAYAVSYNGAIVVGTAIHKGNDYEAYAWSNISGMQGLGDFSGGDRYSSADAISADGTVIAGSGSVASGQVAAYWNSSGAMISLGSLAGYSDGSYANGISSNGSLIVGNAYNNTGAGTSEGWYWTQSSGIQGIGMFAGSPWGSSVSAVSGDGQVIVGSSGYELNGFVSTQGFRWTTSDGMQPLVPLGDFLRFDPSAVNSDGSIIVGFTQGNGSVQLGLWSMTSGLSELGVQSGYAMSFGKGVSADGTTVVGTSYDSTYATSDAFVWSATAGFRSLSELLYTEHGLDVGGWTNLSAAAISGDGYTIVGTGIDPYGNESAWAANISAVPVPGALYFMLSGLTLLGILRKKQ